MLVHHIVYAIVGFVLLIFEYQTINWFESSIFELL